MPRFTLLDPAIEVDYDDDRPRDVEVLLRARVLGRGELLGAALTAVGLTGRPSARRTPSASSWNVEVGSRLGPVEARQ